MSMLKLKISGMHCDSCSRVITMDLEEVDGVEKVEIDQTSKLAEITYDENKTSQEEILQSIKNSGYQGERI